MSAAAPEATARTGWGERLAPRALAGALTARPHLPAMVGVLALAGLLRCWQLEQNGYANTYYSAAVRSMLRSVSNFVFVSFDAGGLQSVDKPPLALWVQALSAKAFGLSSLSLLLPQALAGVAAVWLTYALVARSFGRWAGVGAALALAVAPVAVAIDRDNNPDSLLVLLLVAATYAGVRAVQEGRLRWLLTAGVLIGLAFETKMAVALILIPGLGLAYLLLAPVGWRRRLGHLSAATAAMLVVGGAWVAAVALTPAADRPWIGGTSDNSALGLLLEYNGFGRLTGQEGGTSTGGGFGGILFGGEPGPFRLLQGSMGDQGAWLLPLAVFGGALALVVAIRGRDRRRLAALIAIAGWLVVGAAVFSYASGIVHAYYVSAIAPPIAALVGIGAAQLVESIRQDRRLLAVAAAAIGLTAWLQISLIQRSGYLAWLVVLIVGAATAAGALLLLARGRPALLRAGVVLACAGLLVAPAAWARTTTFEPISGVSPGAGPDAIRGLVATGSPGGFGNGGGPGAAPRRTRDGRAQPSNGAGGSPGFGGGGTGNSGTGGTGGFGATSGFGGPGLGGWGGVDGTGGALEWVAENGATDRFPLIVQSQQGVATLVTTGSHIAALGGFSGRETTMSAGAVARLVAAGEARYFLLTPLDGRPGDTRGTSGATDGIIAVCAAVPASSWNPTAATDGGSSATLYDCAGQGTALAAVEPLAAQ